MIPRPSFFHAAREIVSSVNTVRQRAEAQAAVRYDPALYPELFQAAVDVEISFIALREGRESASRALAAAGGDTRNAFAIRMAEIG